MPGLRQYLKNTYSIFQIERQTLPGITRKHPTFKWVPLSKEDAVETGEWNGMS